MSQTVEYYKIADMIIEIKGEEAYFSQRLEVFQYDGKESVQMSVSIQEQDYPAVPFSDDPGWKPMGQYLLYFGKDEIIQYYPHMLHAGPRYILYSEHFHRVKYFFADRWEDDFVQNEMGYERYRRNIQIIFMKTFQQAFFNMVLFEQGMSVHSSSLIYENAGIIFSAPSGTGKTTHTRYWTEVADAEILDGDVTVCREIDGQLFIYGLPWCGSSAEFQNRKVKLKSIVFLGQGSENTVRRPDEYEAFQRVFASTFSEAWDQQMLSKRMECTEKIVKQVPCFYYDCKNEQDAVWPIKKVIDEI